MSNTAIQIEGLGKVYEIGAPTSYRTVRDSLPALFRAGINALRRRGGKADGSGREQFWALRDVCCEIQHGEVLGVIGNNGAGKSTLLKIISRITEPTEGYADIHGRVGALLEVGTGFHPELTGRENIFLNGAILGMSRAEILRKFDEIVAFSEIEKFIDTPVKHYSSGMYVRLAFAVAAHLDPEILIVDEVLAVGDAAFQKKCLGKVQDISTSGRTVMMVSHNMAAVEALCSRCMLLSGGRVTALGPTRQVIAQYFSNPFQSQNGLRTRVDRRGNGKLRVIDLRVRSDGTGGADNVARSGEQTCIEVYYENHTGERLRNVAVDVGIYDSFARNITFLQNELLGQVLEAGPREGV